MTNLRKLSMYLIFFFSSPLVFGQIGTGLENSLGLNIGNLRNGAGMNPIKDETLGGSIKGSSLLLESNYTGKIKFVNEKLSKVVTLNYDLLTGTTIVYTNNENYGITSDYVNEIILESTPVTDETRFIKVDYEGINYIMEMLVDGEFILLKEHSAKLLKPRYNQALDTGEKRYTIKKRNRYFLYYRDEVLLLPKKSNTLFKENFLPDGLREDFPHRKYSIKKESQLIEAFQLINKI